MWKDMYTGTIYEDEDRVREVAKEEMDKYDYLEKLHEKMTTECWFDIVMEHCPETIMEQLEEIEEEYFNERFCEVEEEE